MISFFIGIPFFLSAITKSIDAGHFLRQIGKLRLPTPITSLIAVCVLSTLWFLAGSLLISRCTSIAIPLAKLFLFLAIPLTVIRWILHKRPSCGCYGPGIRVPPIYSIGIDTALLIGLSNLSATTCTRESLQFLLIPIILGVVLSRMSQQKPLLDLSPTAVKKRWTHHSFGKDKGLIAFVSPKCAVCAQWFPILQAANRKIPVLIVSTEEFEHAFPNLSQKILPRKKLLSWVESFPTVLLIENEIIEARWRGIPKSNMLDHITS